MEIKLPTFEDNIGRFIRMQNLFGPTSSYGQDMMVGQGMPTQPVPPTPIPTFPAPVLQPTGSLLPSPEQMAPGPTAIEQTVPAQQIAPQSSLSEKLLEGLGDNLNFQNQISPRLLELLQQIPQRGKPGVMDRLSSIASGIAYGPQEAERALYSTYNRKLADWQAQFGPLSQLAEQERAYNLNVRSLVNSAIAQERADTYASQQAAQQRRWEDQTRQGLINSEIAQERNEIARARAEGFNRIVPDINGNVWGVNARGETKQLNIRQLSEEGKIRLGLERAESLERLQADLMLRNQTEIARLRRDFGLTGVDAATTYEGALEQTRNFRNRAEFLINRYRGSGIEDFISFNEDGFPQVAEAGTQSGTAVGSFFGGGPRITLTEEINKQLIYAIFGTGQRQPIRGPGIAPQAAPVVPAFEKPGAAASAPAAASTAPAPETELPSIPYKKGDAAYTALRQRAIETIKQMDEYEAGDENDEDLIDHTMREIFASANKAAGIDSSGKPVEVETEAQLRQRAMAALKTRPKFSELEKQPELLEKAMQSMMDTLRGKPPAPVPAAASEAAAGEKKIGMKRKFPDGTVRIWNGKAWGLEK